MRKVLFFVISILLFCISSFGQESEQLRVLEKPTPTLTEERLISRPHLQGTIILRVTFLASAQIGEISLVSGLPDGLNDNAIEAAKKIKFEPATKDGTPVNVTKQV